MMYFFIMPCEMMIQNIKTDRGQSSFFFFAFLVILTFACRGETKAEQCLPIKMDNRTEIIHTNFGFRMFIDKNDQGISQQLKNERQHNRPVIDFLIRNMDEQLQTGAQFNIVHVGAHLGTESLALAHHIGKKWNLLNNIQLEEKGQQQREDKGQQYKQKKEEEGKMNKKKIKIIVFEPEPFSFILLTKSVYLNNLENIIQVYNYGVFSHFSSGQIAVKLSDTSSSQILQVASTKRKADYKRKVTLVPLFPLQNPDKIQTISQQDIKKSSLIYISCHSLQVEILAGLSPLFTADTSKLMVLVKWNHGSTPPKNIQLLQNFIETIQHPDNNFKMLQIVNMRDQSELEYKEITRLRQLISIKDGWVVFIGPDRQII